VSILLAKIGITASDAGEKVGKVAIAYAAHKAASPIRFPPTVALTPVVANWIGKNTIRIRTKLVKRHKFVLDQVLVLRRRVTDHAFTF